MVAGFGVHFAMLENELEKQSMPQVMESTLNEYEPSGLVIVKCFPLLKVDYTQPEWHLLRSKIPQADQNH